MSFEATGYVLYSVAFSAFQVSQKISGKNSLVPLTIGQTLVILVIRPAPRFSVRNGRVLKVPVCGAYGQPSSRTERRKGTGETRFYTVTKTGSPLFCPQRRGSSR